MTMNNCTISTIIHTRNPSVNSNMPNVPNNRTTSTMTPIIDPVTDNIICSRFDMATAATISGMSISMRMDIDVWNRLDARRRVILGKREKL